MAQAIELNSFRNKLDQSRALFLVLEVLQYLLNYPAYIRQCFLNQRLAMEGWHCFTNWDKLPPYCLYNSIFAQSYNWVDLEHLVDHLQHHWSSFIFRVILVRFEVKLLKLFGFQWDALSYSCGLQFKTISPFNQWHIQSNVQADERHNKGVFGLVFQELFVSRENFLKQL